MSLRPGQQRELARIEDWLHQADPELAEMLAASGRPVQRRPAGTRTPIPRWLVSPGLARRRYLALAAVVVLAIGLLIASAVLH